jgi:hypothetical protein
MKLQNKTSLKFFLAILMLLFFTGNSIFGQDIIVKKNGDEIKAKVDQVLDQDIRYRKFENLTGPVYSVVKSEVFMIKYENGTKDIFSTQPDLAGTKQQQTQVPKVSFTSRDLNPARTGAIIHYAIIVPILALGTAAAISSDTDVDTSVGLGAAATVVAGIGIPVGQLIASKTRRTTGVRGSIGLRIAGWAGYGLTLADAITMLALSEDVDFGPGLIVSVAILGALSTTCLGLDNSQSVSQAKSLQPKITLQPTVGSFRDYTGRHQTIGIRINF